jgi:hypothetical protein
VCICENFKNLQNPIYLNLSLPPPPPFEKKIQMKSKKQST